VSVSYTDWAGLTVPQIWAMLAPLDTGPQWTHVGGWRRAAELTAHHLARMADYRARIAAAWPPERNEAARAYLTTLDEMIVSMRATHEAALANYGTIATTTAALDMARLKVKPIFDEYVANERVLARPAVMPSPGQVPVTQARQEALALQARNIMVELSGTLAAAQYAVVTPPAYTAPQITRDGVESFGPPAPRRTGRPPGERLVPPAIAPIGRTSQPTAPTTPSQSSARPRPQRDAGAAIAGPTPPPTIVRPVYTGPVRPGPPGGLIGAPPALGLAQPSSALSVPRVNPVGGVVSNSLPTTGGVAGVTRSDSTTRARSAPPVPPAPPGSFLTPDGHRVSIRTASTRRRDPDNPWTANEGVPPVVTRPTEPIQHDPGPAIGLAR